MEGNTKQDVEFTWNDSVTKETKLSTWNDSLIKETKLSTQNDSLTKENVYERKTCLSKDLNIGGGITTHPLYQSTKAILTTKHNVYKICTNLMNISNIQMRNFCDMQ